MPLSVWYYDVAGNPEDGWEINDRIKFLTVDELDEIPDSDEELLQLFKDVTLLNDKVKLSEVEFDGDDSMVAVFDAETGEPIGQITRD